MLDRLPTELLIKVFRHAAPLDYSPSFYLERRELLFNCCLVSRRLRAIAQPMLPEVFLASEGALLNELSGGRKEAAGSSSS
jgi:hypothetical protein